jgi:hypothetical protein
VQFREYLEEETRLEFELFESIHLEDQDWIADESVMDILRGTGRVIKGVAQTGSGIMSMGDEALARAVGDGTKGRFKGGWDRFARGVGNIGSGVKQAVVGEPRGSSPVQSSPVQSSPSSPASASSASDQVQKKSQLKFKVGKEEKIESDLQSLINQYRAAKGSGDRNRILAVIAMRHPKWYQAKLSQARSRQSARVAPAV